LVGWLEVTDAGEAENEAMAGATGAAMVVMVVLAAPEPAMHPDPSRSIPIHPDPSRCIPMHPMHQRPGTRAPSGRPDVPDAHLDLDIVEDLDLDLESEPEPEPEP